MTRLHIFKLTLTVKKKQLCLCVHLHNVHVCLNWYAVEYIPGFESGLEIQCFYPPKPTQLSNLLYTAVVAVTHGSKTTQIDTQTHRKNTQTHTHSLTPMNMPLLRGESRKAEKPHVRHLNEKDCLWKNLQTVKSLSPLSA